MTVPNTKPDELVREINERAFVTPLECEVGRVVKVTDVYQIVANEVFRQSAALKARAEHIEREGRPHVPQS